MGLTLTTSALAVGPKKVSLWLSFAKWACVRACHVHPQLARRVQVLDSARVCVMLTSENELGKAFFEIGVLRPTRAAGEAAHWPAGFAVGACGFAAHKRGERRQDRLGEADSRAAR